MPPQKPSKNKPRAGAAHTSAANAPESGPQRLQKILAAAGVASRRKAEELIAQGRVQVNKETVSTLGTKADPQHDDIRVDGKRVHAVETYRYFMLNKPRGYVTTTSDPEGRQTVMEFFSRIPLRLYPVGRLDYLSDGLLLVTNDGALAQKLTHASSHVPKTYLVKVSGVPTEDALNRLRRGVSIPLGKPGSNEGRVKTAPAKIRSFREGDNPWYEVTLTEGRNRQLRKMFEHVGHHVEKIRRIAYGPLTLDLEPGQVRELTPQEVRALQRAATAQSPARTAAEPRSAEKPRPPAAKKFLRNSTARRPKR